jgi:hypothetical protein
VINRLERTEKKVCMSRSGAAVTLFISGLLALSACGSNTPASPPAGPARSAPSTTSGPGPSASPDSVHIGPYTQVFADPLPANPDQGSVMEGFREAWILWDKSELAWHLIAPVTDYVTGDALTRLNAAMTFGKTRDLVPAGTDRFFMTRVTAIAGDSATVTTCDDGSKYEEKNARTGRIDTAYSTPLNQAYLFETWHMAQRSGRWAVTSFSLAPPTDPSAKLCQP